MAAEAVGEQEVLHLGVRAEDGVVIQGVVVVLTGPGVDHLDRLERRYTLGQRQPDALFELGMNHLEIVVVDGGIGIRLQRAEEELAFRAAEDAGRIDDGRHLVGDLLAAVEDEDAALARHHRNAQVGHLADLVGAWAGGIEHAAAVDGLAGLQLNGFDAVAGTGQADHFVVDVLDA
ncbi:hypothetical protein D9M70_555730 [compost metagenome]